MKLSVLIFLVLALFNLSIFSQRKIDFNKCKDSLEPAVCSAKLLSLKIEELKGHLAVPRVLSGIYTYEKGFGKELVGKRKIKVKGSNVKYYGSSGDLYATFQCLPGKQICRSINNDKHMLAIMNGNEFFIDWNDDTNGHYRWVAHKKNRPNQQ